MWQPCHRSDRFAVKVGDERMPMTILVTGATGQLGAPTVAALRAAGHDVRGTSRRGRNGSMPVDLFTSAGLQRAMAGVDTVVHCAQTMGKRDPQLARNLTNAASGAGVRHLVLISIVGIDRIPLPYYRQRLEIEEIAQASGLGLTIQRATQFHTLVDQIFSVQRFLPVVLVPGARVQPVAVTEVAARLAELAAGDPQGRVGDIGGPQQLTFTDCHQQWKRAKASHRNGIRVHLPGRIFAGLDTGANLVQGQPYGRETFGQFLQVRYGGA
jgi:uncharacterized protein YbjT (DUF2867 family)